VNGNYYWYDQSLTVATNEDRVLLLQNYDEFIVSYADRSLLVDERHLPLLGDRTNPLLYNCIVFRGQVVGMWSRKVLKKEIIISWQLFDSTTEQLQALHEALKRYGGFLGLPIKCDEVKILG
jgi:hypothetical protein